MKNSNVDDNEYKKIGHKFLPFIEINYVFLEETERILFSKHNQEYLIKQVNRYSFRNINNQNVHNMVLQNPVTNMFWFFKDSLDTKIYNNHYKTTIKGRNPLKSAQLKFSGKDRIQERESEYFSSLQLYQHGFKRPINSFINLYSFEIMNSRYEIQPNGSCNMSRIDKIQLNTTIENYIFEQSPSMLDNDYELVVYVENLNLLKIMSGMASVAFVS